jgi:hypothetical protein
VLLKSEPSPVAVLLAPLKLLLSAWLASFETTNLRPALAAGNALFVAFRAEVGKNLLVADA